MVLYPLHFLIILMPLPCHKDNIARLRQCHGGADCFATVNDAKRLPARLRIIRNPGLHVTENIGRLLESRVVRCEDNLVGKPCSLLDRKSVV